MLQELGYEYIGICAILYLYVTDIGPKATPIHNVHLPVNTFSMTNPLKKAKKKGGKVKLTLDDIGAPTNFVHIQGSKLEAGGELQMVNNLEEIEPGMRQIFLMAGLDTSILHDPKKKREIECLRFLAFGIITSLCFFHTRCLTSQFL